MSSKLGETEFASKVYKVVSRIPKGVVVSYGEVARRAGRAGAARAVGTCMRLNPYPTDKVPCHRVIRSDGYIGNYSLRGGQHKKEELLRSEGVRIKRGRVVS